MPGEITQLLEDVRLGKRDSQQKLLEAVYDELHRLASAYMRRERKDHTLQSSALVNEAYMRLLGDAKLSWESRGHFYVAAAQTMRRTLIDHARRRAAGKRLGMARPVALSDSLAIAQDAPEQMLDLDRALDRLAKMDARQSRIVELRFFAGLSVDETAEVLGISAKTVKRDWSSARAWLEGELREGDNA
jgi:RNA polymerase sigma factor (TIGR02999 family)